MGRTGSTEGIVGGVVLILASLPVFIWGCMNYAEGKGHTKWIGLVGIAGIVGLIVLVVLPDRERYGPLAPLQVSKIIALMALVAGFGLAMQGIRIHDLGIARRFDAPGFWCMLAGACLVVVSLPFLIRSGRSQTVQESEIEDNDNK